MLKSLIRWIRTPKVRRLDLGEHIRIGGKYYEYKLYSGMYKDGKSWSQLVLQHADEGSDPPGLHVFCR